MIIKYGTSESATVVETKNIPSWIGATVPALKKESSDADALVDEKDEEADLDQEEE